MKIAKKVAIACHKLELIAFVLYGTKNHTFDKIERKWKWDINSLNLLIF